MYRPIGRLRLAWLPIREPTGRWAGRRVEPRLVRLAGANGIGHLVVHFEDRGFRFVLAVVFGFVLAPDDGEGLHDISDRVSRGRKHFE